MKFAFADAYGNEVVERIGGIQVGDKHKMDMFKLITSIRKRPLMYVKEEKIEYIYYLLSGYCAAGIATQEDSMNKKFVL